jgi:cyclopropane fatty-acyl-phospholipid synthase-like methyltransferase
MANGPSRIATRVAEIDYGSTLRFFEERALKAPEVGPLSVTMYQDRHPELAAARDRHEKEKVTPLLGLHPAMRVLDIGSGSGRWGLDLCDRVAAYLGVDFSANLVSLAEAELRERGVGDSYRFQTLAAYDIAAENLALPPPFDLFLIAGLMTYLNDGDCRRTLAHVAGLAAPGARVYIREPMGVADRLTLKGHYSDELQSEYNAIYRTRAEYGRILESTLLGDGFTLRVDEDLYDEALSNRTETRQRILLLERDGDE